LLPIDYAPFISWVQKHSRLKDRTFPAPFPETLQELRPHSAPAPLSLAAEFQWCACRLSSHLKAISSFNQVREQLEDAFVEGNEARAFSLLSTIEESYGTSIWLIKKKVMLLQEYGGLEKQKEYANSIKDGRESCSSLVQYITHFISYRSEPSVSPLTFRTIYEVLLGELDATTDVTAYLRQHVLSVPPNTTDELAGMLAIETAGTAIDTYEMFVLAAQRAFAIGHHSLCRELAAIVREVAARVTDIRLTRLLFLLGGSCDPADIVLPAQAEPLAALFPSSLEAVSPSSGNPVDAGGVSATSVVSALALALPNRSLEIAGSISPTILTAMEAVLSGTAEQEAGAVRLLRNAWVLDGGCASRLLRLVLDWSGGVYRDARGRPEWLGDIAGLGRLFPFELWWIMDSDLRGRYVETFARYHAGPQDWLDLEANTLLCPPILPDCSRHPFPLWRTMHLFLRIGDLAPALAAAKQLLQEEKAFLKRQAVRAIPFCLSEPTNLRDCVSFLAEQAVLDGSMERIMPIKEIVESLSSEEKESLTDSLAYVVLTDLYVSRSSSDLAHLRSFAAEDFLLAHSLSRPSELRSHASLYDRCLLIHFLRHTCVENVMDTWTAFSSSQEVARERAAVCQLVAELAPSIRDECHAEIRDIMRRLTLSARLREVEQSKIHVDVSSVKIVARKTLTESFSRYMDFLRTGMTPDEKSRMQDTRMRVARGDVEALLGGAFPRNEMTDLFESLVVRLRDEFVSSSQHGLDGYLSVRVRHGTLSGQLRRPLESESLVTLRDSTTGKYKENTFWPGILGIAGTDEQTILQEALAQFTESFDSLIEEINSSWLQVRKRKEDSGLIDFTLLRPEVNFLSTEIRDDMTFDSFLESIFSHFFSEKLEPSLEKIRTELQENAKPRASDLLLKLQTTAEEKLGGSKIWRLRSSIGRARTQIQTVINRITEWFRISRSEMSCEPFSIEEVVNIGAASIQAACPDFQADVETSPDLHDFLISGNLTSFVDLLFLIFENAVRHSQLSPFPSVKVSAFREDGVLHIRVENGLGEAILGKEKAENLARIRENLRVDVFSPSVNTEGGTGFYKMQKILYHDFCPPTGDRKPSLDFGLSGDSSFFVHITMPVREWKSEDTQDENTHN
jgi:hypothetical protein